MKKTFLGLALLLAAGAARADAAATFQARCAICHGKDGKGSPAGKKMGAKDLTALTATQEQIEKSIAQGKGKMQPYKGKLSDDEIAALAKYIKAGLK